MTAILFVWTVVAVHGWQGSAYREWDWRPFGEFKNTAACAEAARQLQIDSSRFRCVLTGK